MDSAQVHGSLFAFLKLSTGFHILSTCIFPKMRNKYIIYIIIYNIIIILNIIYYIIIYTIRGEKKAPKSNEKQKKAKESKKS